MNRFVVGGILLATACALPVCGAHAAEGFMVENRAETAIDAVFLINESGRSDNLIGASTSIPKGTSSLVSKAPWPGCIHDVIVFMSDDRAGYFDEFDTCTGRAVVTEDMLEIRD